MAKARARHILDQQRKNVRTLKHKLNLVGILLPWRKTIQRALQENKVETLGSLGPVKWLRNLFSGEVGKVHGPVQTKFGYHLLEITSRILPKPHTLLDVSPHCS